MTPLPTNDDIDTWVNKNTSVNDQVSSVTLNGVPFKKIYTCGDFGCSTFYYTIMNGKVYGINTRAMGAKGTEYQETIDQILQTLVLPQ